MTLGEFKAWLSGYCEKMEGAPSVEEWARVLEQLETVTVVSCPDPFRSRIGRWDGYQGRADAVQAGLIPQAVNNGFQAR